LKKSKERSAKPSQWCGGIDGAIFHIMKIEGLLFRNQFFQAEATVLMLFKKERPVLGAIIPVPPSTCDAPSTSSTTQPGSA
jgi:hypothetical protein